MTLDDLSLTLSRVGAFDGSVDLHGFGEPLLDQDLVEKVKLVKSRWPKCTIRILSTLGVRVPKMLFKNLFESGLDVLEVSFYGANKQLYTKTHGSDNFATAKRNFETAAKLDPDRLLLRLMPLHSKIRDHDMSRASLASWAKKWSVRTADERSMHNWGQGLRFNQSGNSLCSVVWGYRKRVLQVTWDLYVIPCCFDFDASIKLGNLRNSSLEEIYESPPYKAFIAAHVEDRLTEYSACQSCEKCLRV